MQPSEFFHKFTSRYLWLNLAAMAAVVVALVVGVSVATNIYTHHGEELRLPDVRRHSYESAARLLSGYGLQVVVTDTGYVKTLPAGAVIEQQPEPGTRMKSGRTVYLTINATGAPTLPLPDLVDNSSLREAQAKLLAMGFRLSEPQYVAGEKDWVYGILADGRSVAAGTRVRAECILTIQVGNGQRDDADTIYTVDTPAPDDDPFGGVMTEEHQGRGDDFEVVE